jgi:hypothetical protein
MSCCVCFVASNDAYWLAKVCHWFPGKRPSDYLSLDEETSYKIDQALVARLEEERTEEFTILLKNILKAGGFEVKDKKNTNINLTQNKNELPTVEQVLSGLMGSGVIME